MRFFIVITLFWGLATAATADTMLVEKKRFELGTFTTFSGKTIKDVAVGWESYGQLNADKSNVILITHYFTGNSHAAGKYSPEDTQAGYWDALIGPGKAIDTNHYFVLSVDSLANLSVHDPNVITTGPASIDPDTGKPYGLSFPVVTIRDFVNVQKALLDALGIHKLHAVMGPSMGSFQAMEWAVAYPDMVERMVSVIGAVALDHWSVALLEHWATPIKLDANWQQGNYYQNQPPVDGLTSSLMLITQNALHPTFFDKVIEGPPNQAQDALLDITANMSVVSWLEARGRARAATMDANHLLYLVRACQLFIAGMGDNWQQGLDKVQAKTLFLPASGDQLLFPQLAQMGHQYLREKGHNSTYAEFDAGAGHLDGVVHINQVAGQIRSFISE
ncbi:MAG: homoserine O-acetyltransferase [Aestuariibacter sp.]